MLAYIIRRLLLIIPTLVGIMVINFFIVQAAPGGPVERTIALIRGSATDATARFGGGAQSETGAAPTTATGEANSQYRGARGMDPKLIKEIEKLYGFDKPPFERFLKMMKQYLMFDFGKSFYSDRTVVSLVLDKMPVSISLGLWDMLLIYLISIPLGIAKAVRDGSRFDVATSAVVIIGYAIPSYLFAVLLIVLFSGGSYFQWFPLRGLLSEQYQGQGFVGCIQNVACIYDYFWHITLPVIAMVVGGFASLTMLTKNSFLEEINKQYVTTARAKGNSERRVLYRHVFRNAMLIVVAGFPGAFIGILFTSAMLIEVIFSLNGLGLLGFEAIVNRDYPVVFGTLYFFTLIGLLLNLIGDLTYTLVDPRIDFEAREV